MDLDFSKLPPIAQITERGREALRRNSLPLPQLIGLEILTRVGPIRTIDLHSMVLQMIRECGGAEAALADVRSGAYTIHQETVQ